MKEESKRVMVITGAASGIGAALARLSASAGYRVIIADVNEGAAIRVAAEIGEAAVAKRIDICSEGSWKDLVDSVFAEEGRLDILVNNAAIVHTGFARDVSIDLHRKTVDTNFFGAVIGMQTVLPRFRAQGFGHLVTVSSMNAFLPFPGIASYSAAKHALRAFHHAVAIEERKIPVDFTIVYPTATETPMLAKEAEDDAMALAFAGQAVTPDFVADAILKGIEDKAVEVFIPLDRGTVVKTTGVDPEALRAMVERNEVIGAEKLRERREKLR
jgi:NAD(P)-dependent dehydrogenase (short-subunit alcohol dehydrogenase family)